MSSRSNFLVWESSLYVSYGMAQLCPSFGFGSCAPFLTLAGTFPTRHGTSFSHIGYKCQMQSAKQPRLLWLGQSRFSFNLHAVTGAMWLLCAIGSVSSGYGRKQRVKPSRE